MRNRMKQVNVRLTEAEYQKMQRNAKRCGLSASGYFRMLLTNRQPKETPPLEYTHLTRALYEALNHMDADDTTGRSEVLNTLVALQQAVTLPERG